jgi:type II secretory pathway pseudopilin PulG
MDQTRPIITRPGSAGFTLTEFVVATAVMVALATTVVTTMVRRLPQLKLDRAAAHVTTDLRLARMQAASMNTDVTVTFNSSASRYSIWIDRDRDGEKSDGEIEMKKLDIDPAQDLWAYPNSGTFHPNGTFTSDSSYSYIRIANPAVGEKLIYVFPSGQIDPYQGDPHETSL